MRYFTQELIRRMNDADSDLAEHAEDEWNSRVDEYQAYLASHKAELPVLAALSLHDFELDAVEFVPTTGDVCVRLIQKDLSLSLTYRSVRMLSLVRLERSAMYPKRTSASIGAVVADEVMMEMDGRFSHAILFESGAELACSFASCLVQH